MAGRGNPTLELPSARAFALALGAVTLAVLALALGHGTAGFDDAYITYTYAKTFAEGGGLTWEGVPVLGTSTPFLAVVLGLLERAWPLGVDWWGSLLGWLSLWGLGLALVALARREGWFLGGAVAALVALGAPGLVKFIGSEFLPAVALVVVAAWALASGRRTAAGVALALAVALRTEMGIAALALAGAFLVAERGRWRDVTRVAGLALALWGLWLLALWRIAGTLVPSTLAAKQAQGASVLGIWPAGRGLVENLLSLTPAALFFRRDLFGNLLAIALPLAGLAAWFLLGRARWRFAAALLLWGPLHLALFALLGVGAYPWYAIPFWLACALAIGLAFELARALPRDRARIAVAVLGVALVAGILGSRDSFGWQLRPAEDERKAVYRQVAELLDTYPPGTRLAAWEVGYLGYYAANPVLDLLGLVTPEVPLDLVRQGQLAEIRERLRPDIVMLSGDGGALVSAARGDEVRFAEDLEEIAEWSSEKMIARTYLASRGSRARGQ